MKLSLAMYFVLFVIYSFVGWLLETSFCFYKTKKLVDRGFLIGPVCPIYGLGCAAIIFFLSRYKNDIVTLFVMAAVICTILEYVTSYLMEKIFHARWWDYSKNKFNLNGRISLNTMIPFGLLGVIAVYIVNPYLIKILSFLSYKALTIISIAIFIIFIIDIIISSNIIFKFRDTIKHFEKDSTEEITKKVKSIFTKKGHLYNRLIKAFEGLKTPKEYLKQVAININTKIKKL